MSGFLYRPDFAGVWFEQVVIRPIVAEPIGASVVSRPYIINLSTKDEQNLLIHASSMLSTIQLEDGEKIYYHGTDGRSAKSILDRGIDLTLTQSRQDFSNGYGFYVTTDCRRAIKWANKKALKSPGESGAVIAFKISRALCQEEPQLSLEVQTAVGRKLWGKIVSCFRRGKPDDSVAALVGNVKFIEGPVSAKAYIRRGEKPLPYNFTQMCIHDANYAKRFGSLHNIYFVIFAK